MVSLIGPAFTALNAILGAPVTQLFKDVINKEENLQILNTDFKRMVNLLLDINALFQHKEPPQTVKHWFQELLKSLTEANKILDHPSGRRRCLGCLICKPARRAWQIREWTVNFDKLFLGLQSDFSTIVNGQHIAKSAPQKALPQSVPAAGFVGSGLGSDQEQIQTWLTETEHVSVIRVCGMAGVGKTSFLKMVYNHYLEEDSEAFEHLIWVTVSTVYNPLDLQARIAKEINLDLPHGSGIDTHKMLSAHLKKKKFLLVLDDVWDPLDLQELGVAFGEGKQSKVLFSTRNGNLILGTMSADKSIEIKALSPDEAWMLFRRIAFNDDTISDEEIVDCARKIAEECKGLPLAITVIAASMIGKTRADQWKISFDLMKTADPYFPKTHPRVDPELYKRLRYSYDALPSLEVKNCFLYCAMYPEDYDIPVDKLVQMWMAEGLVGRGRESHLLDMAIGRSYVDILVDRYLFQNAGYEEFVCPWSFVKSQKIRVHDVIRDMAIYIGEKDENCVYKAGQQLRNFPEIHNEYCKRISLFDCDIENLPTEFTSPKLASLLLCCNQIGVVPSGFLVSLTSLKVLDLSATSHSTSIGSMIPSSVGQLKQLEFLRLNRFWRMEDLPEEVCHLSSLQFLDLSGCGLRSLPSKIGELKTLKYLNLSYCQSLRVIPHEISQLTSLSTLNTYHSSVHLNVEASMWSLKGLVNLAMLTVYVWLQEGMASSGIKVGIMGTWLDMRHLWLHFRVENGVNVVLPEDIQEMSKLQSFQMSGYNGLSLPEYICNFQQLENLQLSVCDHLTGLSPLDRLPKLKYLELRRWYNLKELGIGNSRKASGFLMLEELTLSRLDRLESIAGASNKGVWNELILPNLRILEIDKCPSLKRFPKGMEKLVNLSSIIGSENWWQRIEWKDDNMRSHLQNLFQR